MSEDPLLLTPGPVPVARDVREAMSPPMISHRTPEFEAIYARAAEGLEYVFTRSTPDEEQTAADGRPLLFNATSSLAMEAAVTNLVDPDGEVLALVNGKFGRRFERIADRHASVRTVEDEWGQPQDLDAVAAALDDDVDVVTMVHGETSTGLLNPVEEVGDLVAEHDALLVVDGVSSIGGDEFRIDDWNVDVAITDAQKAIAAPPGISALYATERAIEAFDGDRGPVYMDLDEHVRFARDNFTPFTSAVPLFRAMAAAVDTIREEGMPARIARHRCRAAAFRDAFRAMGLDLFGSPGGATGYTNTVTAVSLPEPLRGDADRFFAAVRKRGVTIAGGHSHLDGQLFRVSSMGDLTDEDILRGVRTIGEALGDVGIDADVEAGIDAGQGALGG